MRDPAGNMTSYAEFFEHYDRHMGWRKEKFATLTLERQIWYSYEQMGLSQKMVLHRYGRGVRCTVNSGHSCFKPPAAVC